jgi:hypothetical protein
VLRVLAVRPPVYIAGPFTGEPVRNTTRACELARHAVSLGYAPFVPHALGFLGVYLPEEDMYERAMDCCLSLLHHLAEADGAELWVILRDDGSPSPGVARELEAWDGAEPTRRTWAEWERELGAARKAAS